MISQILHWVWQLIISAGIILILAYLVYTLGLSLVFRKLGTKMWPAYVPGYNYIVLIRTLGLPKSWQAVAFVPYLGQVYSIPVAIRLGKIFHKNTAFSSLWLTIGAPIGMLWIALSRQPLDLDVIKEPAPRIDTKKIKHLATRRRQ